VPTVDIGVGEQQCGPAFCLVCDWSQEYPFDDEELSDDEGANDRLD